MDEVEIEKVALLLVKDFLSKKKYFSTLSSLRCEISQNKFKPNSMNIISELHLEKMVAKHKPSNLHFISLLEILVKHRLEKRCKTSHSCHSLKSSQRYTDSEEINELNVQLNSFDLYKNTSLYNIGTSTSGKHLPMQPNIISRERRRLRRTSSSETNLVETKLKEKNDSIFNQEKISSSYQDNFILPQCFCPSMINMTNNEDPSLLLPSYTHEERPITVDEACALRLLLFGNTAKSFGSEWIQQSFRFQTQPLSYGIVQKRPGPCGVLAALQAHVLFELLFGYTRTVLEYGVLRPDKKEMNEALARALTNILWQAGEKTHALLATKQDKLILDSSITSTILREDGLMEYLKLKHFRSQENLLNYLFNFISELMINENASCVTFLYSVILTHGIEKIKKEMDNPDSYLIGDDGYCSQEVVNLILIGKAVPNLFNGNLELNLGGNEKSILHGIPNQSNIGLLSLYEYDKQFVVGTYYKNPRYPIWIIHGENHFSVLFGTKREIFNKTSSEDSFELFHYDGLAHRNHEMCYIISIFI